VLGEGGNSHNRSIRPFINTSHHETERKRGEKPVGTAPTPVCACVSVCGSLADVACSDCTNTFTRQDGAGWMQSLAHTRTSTRQSRPRKRIVGSSTSQDRTAPLGPAGRPSRAAAGQGPRAHTDIQTYRLVEIGTCYLIRT